MVIGRPAFQYFVFASPAIEYDPHGCMKHTPGFSSHSKDFYNRKNCRRHNQWHHLQ
jgi:hypothetical protein